MPDLITWTRTGLENFQTCVSMVCTVATSLALRTTLSGSRGPLEVLSSFPTSSKGRIKYTQTTSKQWFLSSILKNLQWLHCPKNLFQHFSIFTARKFPLLSNLSISPLPHRCTTSSPTYQKKNQFCFCTTPFQFLQRFLGSRGIHPTVACTE